MRTNIRLTVGSTASRPWIAPERIARDGLLCICAGADTACIDQASRYETPDTRKLIRVFQEPFWGLRGLPIEVIMIMVPPRTLSVGPLGVAPSPSLWLQTPCTAMCRGTLGDGLEEEDGSPPVLQQGFIDVSFDVRVVQSCFLDGDPLTRQWMCALPIAYTLGNEKTDTEQIIGQSSSGLQFCSVLCRRSCISGSDFAAMCARDRKRGGAG
jgi:hypothetical protein